VFINEGEKSVDQLHELGLTATCSPGGAGKWRPDYAKYLRVRRVAIIADRDDAGESHAEDIERSLKGIAASATILRLLGLPHKGDVVDWLAKGGTAQELRRIAFAQTRPCANRRTTWHEPVDLDDWCAVCHTPMH
jgi:putative DNA primase/helicase